MNKNSAFHESSQTLVLIDGNAMIHRAFHAFPPEMTTKSGEPTNAVYGFARMLLDVYKNYRPAYLALTFDYPAKTFRHQALVSYKAHRPPIPDNMKPQFARVHQIVDTFGIPAYELEGYEADDLLGTLSRQAMEKKVNTLIATGDTDTLQLVNEQVKVTFARSLRKGEMEFFDIDAVKERYSIDPSQLPDYKALLGDTSDNIPGVRGIGQKTASKLIAEYGNLESLLDHLSELPEKTRVTLQEGAEQARQSKMLATIVCDAPVQLDLERCKIQVFDKEKIFSLFRELEFFSLVERVPELLQAGSERSQLAISKPKAIVPAPSGQMSLFGEQELIAIEVAEESQPDLLEIVPAEQIIKDITTHTSTLVVNDEQTLGILASSLARSGGFAFDTETTSRNQMVANLVGISLSMGQDEAYYIPVGHTGGQKQLPLGVIQKYLKPVFGNPEIPKYAHNAKYDMVILYRHGMPVEGIKHDTMISAYLLNPGRRGIGLKELSFEYLNTIMTPITDLIGKGAQQKSMDEVDINKAADYAGSDALQTWKLVPVFSQGLQEHQLEKLFSEIEMPLVPVLATMEMNGIKVDPEFLQNMERDLTEQLGKLEMEIYGAVGHHFNINSTKQLADILFKELKLPPTRRTKTGFSVDAEVLESLRGMHEVVDYILEYRQLLKLKSTYVDGLLPLINPNGNRVHTSFNQTIAATGRLSSTDPNLQNIPIRSEVGRQIRKAFIAEEGCVLLAADYSQVELRILAHITGEPALVQAFEGDEDVHSATASRMFNVPIEEVTKDQRRLGKTMNFAIIYGQTPFGLARVANIPVNEAANFIKNYEATFPGVKEYVEETLKQAKEVGYVQTLFGRKKFVPDLSKLPVMQRQAIERESINMPIQGTNADIIKLAMINIQKQIEEQGLRMKMILQVHDELVFEVPEGEIEAARPLVKHFMENAMELRVPLKVELKQGKNWFEVEPVVEFAVLTE